MNRRTAMMVTTAAAVTFPSAIGNLAQAQSSYPSGLPWRSGFRTPDNKPATLSAIGTWRGRKVDMAHVFVGSESWQTWDTMLQAGAINSTGRAFHAAGFPLLIAIPLLQGADKGNFARAATTANAGHATLAQKVFGLTGGAPCWVRIGWEANKGYHWSYANHGGSPDPAKPADYKLCWRNAALAWREHCPNAKLVWNHLKFPVSSASSITAYYPGDDVVDVVSVNPYDNGSWGYADTDQGFNDAILGMKGGFSGFDPATGKCQGMNGIRLFATSRGKKWATDEWAPTNATKSSSNRANNSYYCGAMFAYFKQHAASLEYECFFNGPDHQIYPRVTYNGKASDAYQAAW